ncbi:MAG: hypothetical protein ACM31L_12780 [Actinomycetota bacterium]
MRPTLAVAFVALVLASCSSSVETARLATVRQELEQARADTAVARYAPVPLHDAEQSLAAAEAASK